MIIIKEIELENYRQYRGRQHIVLDYDPNGKNIIIIEGVNGAGKTNLLNAIAWCLYGKEPYLSEISRRYPIVNISEIEDKGHATVSVRIYFKVIKSNREIEFMIERKQEFYKENDELRKNRPELMVMLFDGLNWSPIPSPTDFIQNLFPEEIKDFYLFDGEKLDNLFKYENTQKIRESIIEISQINIIDRAIKHLEELVKKYEREASKLSPNLAEIRNKLEQKRKRKESLEKEYKKLLRELEMNKNNLEKIREELDKIKHKDFEKLQKERRELTIKLKELQSEYDDLKDEYTDTVLQLAPLVFVYKAIFNLKKEIDSRYKSGELPPKIKKTFIEELLRRNVCICGADLKDPERRKHLQKMLEEAKIADEIDAVVSSAKFELEYTIRNIQPLIQKKNKLGKKIAKIESEMAQIRTKINEITAQMRDIDEATIKQLIEMERRVSKYIEECQRKIGAKEFEIKQLELEIKELEGELSKGLKKIEKARKIDKKIKVCRQIIEVLKDIKNSIFREIIQTLNKKTNEYFKSIATFSELFDRVEINDNFTVSIYDKEYGQDVLGSLSAGYRQILALSYIMALQDISGFKAPLIIDTPLARISGEHRRRIANILANKLKETQIILLVTDQEYTPEVRKIIRNSLVNEYELIFNEEKRMTLINKR